MKDNILPHITEKDGSQVDYKRNHNVGSFTLESSISPRADYGTRKVSTIMADNKYSVPVIEINSVIHKTIHHIPVSGNVLTLSLFPKSNILYFLCMFC